MRDLKIDHLNSRLSNQKKEVKKSPELKYQFLRNIEHELRTPINDITTIGQVLWENYDKLTEEQRKEAVQEIGQNSEKLSSLINNILDLSKLHSLKYNLDLQKINFSELVYERIEFCKKLYAEKQNSGLQEFILDIEDNVLVYCDKYYTARAIDNIIINAIQYCPKGKIIISLYKDKSTQEIKFSVTDYGIGISKELIHEIFNSFVVSSRNNIKAGARGIGLGVAEKVINLHKGKIKAKSSKKHGTVIQFTLPMTEN